MDEFKPEDELKPDPSDRRTGRSRQSSERDNEPQINFDDVDLDADDRRPSRSRNARDEREEEDYESEEDSMDEQPVERRPRKRKKAAAQKPASRQYIMMGLGVLVLVLLIVGIGSALKAPSTNSTEQTPPQRRASTSPVMMRRIRRMVHSQRRAPLPLSRLPATQRRRRMFLCRPFHQRLLRARHLSRPKASSVLKFRET